MKRLNETMLASVSATQRTPRYDRTKLEIGLAHIGVGAFHRCHQAEFTDDMLEMQMGSWGIVGINLQPPLIAQALMPQDGLYTRTILEHDRRDTRIIGAIRKAIDVVDRASADGAVAVLASPGIKAVTLTVTEKGYCHTPASGKLDWSNRALIEDRDGAWPPATVLGLLAAALERRRLSGMPGLTLMSCDNVPSNGELLRSTLMPFAASGSTDLAGWIERNVAFPSTMVDRIVPAPTDADRDAASLAIGLRDEAAVVGEPFRQWVIEDRFARDRPPWDLTGAQFVADVTPYELIKMRVLNAAQSTLSHLGAIVGLTYSFEAVADPVLLALVRRMLETETKTTLPDAPGMPADAYVDTSLRRIANTAIRHRCHQIGTDGSQKIVQRVVNPLRERLAAGHAPGLLGLAVASWIAYGLCGAKRYGARWKPDDPWAERVISLGEEIGEDWQVLADRTLGIEAIFGKDLANSLAGEAIGRHLRGLLSPDPHAYLRGLVSD